MGGLCRQAQQKNKISLPQQRTAKSTKNPSSIYAGQKKVSSRQKPVALFNCFLPKRCSWFDNLHSQNVAAFAKPLFSVDKKQDVCLATRCKNSSHRFAMPSLRRKLAKSFCQKAFWQSKNLCRLPIRTCFLVKIIVIIVKTFKLLYNFIYRLSFCSKFIHKTEEKRL